MCRFGGVISHGGLTDTWPNLPPLKRLFPLKAFRWRYPEIKFRVDLERNDAAFAENLALSRLSYERVPREYLRFSGLIRQKTCRNAAFPDQYR